MRFVTGTMYFGVSTLGKRIPFTVALSILLHADWGTRREGKHEFCALFLYLRDAALSKRPE